MQPILLEQLQLNNRFEAKKINIPIVKQKMGSDPAAVTYDTIQSAISNDFDYVIIDTAGRLHNKNKFDD